MPHVPSEPDTDVSEQSALEPDHTAVDRRSFIRGAAVVGAVVVGVTALVPPAEAAKRCYPLPPKKPSVVDLTIESETGVTLPGSMDLDTVKVVSGTLTVTLHFDRYEDGGSIVSTMDSLTTLTLVDADLHRPPRLLLTWGTGKKIQSFRGVLEGVSVAYTASLADGTPVGALAVARIQILEDCAVV